MLLVGGAGALLDIKLYWGTGQGGGLRSGQITLKNIFIMTILGRPKDVCPMASPALAPPKKKLSKCTLVLLCYPSSILRSFDIVD